MDKGILHLYEMLKEYSSRDFKEIESWYNQRNQVVKEELLPKVGFIVPGVAAGFLIQTDCQVCFLEPFIANPKALKDDRNEALSLIMSKLIESAKSLEYQYIFGISTSQTMINRALDQGFIDQGFNSLVIKDLT